MIEQFNDVEIRDSGIIYNSTFEQIKKLYAMDPEKAGELAISAIELVLTGDISSDDAMIDLFLEPLKIINAKNKQKYDQRAENQKNKKITDMKLDKIAELLEQGYKQREIGERLGMSQQVISYRISVIKKDYPELLQNFVQNTKKVTKSTKDTNFVQNEKVCTNDTKFVQVGEICTKKVQDENIEETKSADGQPEQTYAFVF